MYIDGKWVDAKSGRTFAVHNPANGEIVDHMPDGGGVDAVMAVDAAHRAFGGWSALTAYQRADYLYEAHRLMMENLEPKESFLGLKKLHEAIFNRQI